MKMYWLIFRVLITIFSPRTMGDHFQSLLSYYEDIQGKRSSANCTKEGRQKVQPPNDPEPLYGNLPHEGGELQRRIGIQFQDV